MILFLLLSFFSIAHADVPETVRLVGAENLATSGLVPGAESRIHLFAGEKKTPLVFLYLHGFSASPPESSPLVENLANEFHANAYLPRFRGHGIGGAEGLRGVKLEDWEKEVREFLRRARELGEQVVVVGMSTGASLAIPALLEDSSQVAATVFLSPSFRLHRLDSELLRLPFGAWITHLFFGEFREWQPRNELQAKYWTTRYPAEILVEPVRSAAKARGAELEDLKVPALWAYSPADQVISPASVVSAFYRLGGKPKDLVPITGAGDEHVIVGDILSPEGTRKIFGLARGFLRRLHLAGTQTGLRKR